MKKAFYISLTLLLASLLIKCKDTNNGFSPGPGDPRITGTWQLVERYFSKDSANSVLTVNLVTRQDSILVTVGNQVVKRDTLITTYDTIYVRRDTSFYTTKRYASIPPQTLTFDADGKLTASGSEMTYYNPIKYFLVDKTYPDSLFIDFFISTNRANVPVQQGLEFRLDTLMLEPRCDQKCYSKFVRVR
ncbi:hypothetical protein [Spirosoma flavum]|uniref:Lipocalin-like domain-containing protein n=1 Tax=Spirosoma flavum TaxID=2048557 RepID=A0ABW6AV50_9BACT